MSDYSEAEQLAINDVFPQCTVYLCDLHREQAWERWVRDHHHGLSRDEGDKLLQLLRECAHAPTPRPQENVPQDHYYNLAVNHRHEAIMLKFLPIILFCTSQSVYRLFSSFSPIIPRMCTIIHIPNLSQSNSDTTVVPESVRLA